MPSPAEWLDMLAACADRIAGRAPARPTPAFTDPVWRDAEGNVLTRHPNGKEDYVMVQYERPMMEAIADVICKDHGSVLNVGFGCGLIDGAIQQRGVARHVIVEAHTQVLGWMRDEGWYERPNVEVLASPWQDVVWQPYKHAFDGVFFDTYPYVSGISWDNVLWHEVVRHILKPETGVCVLYAIGGWTEKALEKVRQGFFRDEVTIGWTKATVDVPFVIPEWESYGVGRHELDIPYFSLRPKTSTSR